MAAQEKKQLHSTVTLRAAKAGFRGTTHPDTDDAHESKP
jgi:hypothetical protein